MELTFDKGRGYVPAERNKLALVEKNDVTTLPVDSIYTPRPQMQLYGGQHPRGPDHRL